MSNEDDLRDRISELEFELRSKSDEIASLRRKLDERTAAEGLRNDCKHEGATVSHCPYQSEINGDESPCRCCDGCRHECLMDI